MAELSYTKDDLTRVVCNAFKSFLGSSGEGNEEQTAGFMKSLLNAFDLEVSVHCLCKTYEELVLDLKISDNDQNAIDLFKAICESVEADPSQPSVTFGVYVRVYSN